MEPEKFFNVPQTTVTHMPLLPRRRRAAVEHYRQRALFRRGRPSGEELWYREAANDLIEKQERLKQETERASDSGRLKSVFSQHDPRDPHAAELHRRLLRRAAHHSPHKKRSKEIIRVFMNNCDMLMRLINDILAISSLDTGGIHLEPAETDFAKSFDDICESLRSACGEPGVAFIQRPYTESFITIIDNARIQRVITNFVTNAVKYTHQGHIKAGYRYEDGQLYCIAKIRISAFPRSTRPRSSTASSNSTTTC